MTTTLPGLRRRRREMGMSSPELARALGCTAAAVSSWERGETLPSADRLPEISRILGCSIDELFREETAEDGGPTRDADCRANRRTGAQ